MSDASQGPGWWLASDGKWYPPESAQPPQLQPPPAAPQVQQQFPPTKSSGKGCLIAVLVVVVLFVGGGAVVVFALGVFANRVADEAIGGGPCPFLSDGAAAEILGDGTTVIEAKGLSQVLVVIDARVMPEDESCAVSRDDNSNPNAGGIGRIARYEGGEAAAKYQAELTKARGITEDRANGITVTSDQYFNKEISGLGDEAFCTKSSGLGAGVLVRHGSTLVYVSVVADASTAPGLDLEDPENPKLGTDDLHCELAQRIATRVLADR